MGFYVHWVWGGRPDQLEVPIQKGSLHAKGDPKRDPKRDSQEFLSTAPDCAWFQGGGKLRNLWNHGFRTLTDPWQIMKKHCFHNVFGALGTLKRSAVSPVVLIRHRFPVQETVRMLPARPGFSMHWPNAPLQSWI